MPVETIEEKLLFGDKGSWGLSVLSIPYVGAFSEVRAEKLSALEMLGLSLTKVEHPDPANLKLLLSIVASSSVKRPPHIGAKEYLKAANTPRSLKRMAKKADLPTDEIAEAVTVGNSSTRGSLLGFYPTYAVVGEAGTPLLAFSTYYAVVMIGSPWGMAREAIKQKAFMAINGRTWPSEG